MAAETPKCHSCDLPVSCENCESCPAHCAGTLSWSYTLRYAFGAMPPLRALRWWWSLRSWGWKQGRWHVCR